MGVELQLQRTLREMHVDRLHANQHQHEYHGEAAKEQASEFHSVASRFSRSSNARQARICCGVVRWPVVVSTTSSSLKL